MMKANSRMFLRNISIKTKDNYRKKKESLKSLDNRYIYT